MAQLNHHRAPRGSVAVSSDILPEPADYRRRRWGRRQMGWGEEVVVTTADGDKRGVAGTGGNAVNNIIAAALQGVDFIVANTDAQALTRSKAIRMPD